MVEIATWRPYGNDVSQQMRRFFTGGAPELEDISYVKIPTESEVQIFCHCFKGVVNSDLPFVHMVLFTDWLAVCRHHLRYQSEIPFTMDDIDGVYPTVTSAFVIFFAKLDSDLI